MESNARGDSIGMFTSKHPGMLNETRVSVLGRPVFVWGDVERCSWILLTAACCLVQMDSSGFLHLIVLAASSFFPLAERHVHEPGDMYFPVTLI